MAFIDPSKTKMQKCKNNQAKMQKYKIQRCKIQKVGTKMHINMIMKSNVKGEQRAFKHVKKRKVQNYDFKRDANCQ